MENNRYSQGILNPQTERRVWIVFIGALVGIAISFINVYINYYRENIDQFLTSPFGKFQTVNVFDEVKHKLTPVLPSINLKHVAGSVEAAEKYSSSSYIAVRLDTGEVVSEKNATQQLPIASLTKIMTAVVTLDLAQSTDLITVSRNASKQIPTKIGLSAGERMTVDELLHATLMTSANDAAEALKDGIDAMYGDAVFIRSMNEKASLLGLTSTHFSNVEGFDDKDNYSSAYDLAKLSDYALKNYPEISRIVVKPYLLLPKSTLHKQYDLYNWNGLLSVYPDVIGMKIGNTDEAGRTTIVISKRQDIPVAVVALGTTSVLERDLLAADLLDSAYQKIADVKPIAISQEQLEEKYRTWRFFQ